MLKIKFKNPSEKIEGERKSKLLSEKCSLYIFVNKIRIWLKDHNYKIDCRSPHIEILNDYEKNDTIELIKRSKLLEGRYISKIIDLLDDALVINTGYVPSYGETHCTIAYFKDGLDPVNYQKILDKIEF